MALSTTLNNSTIGILDPVSVVSQRTCVLPGCNGPGSFACTSFVQSWFDNVPNGDFPGYVHGGMNTFSLTLRSRTPRSDIPTLAVEKVLLDLTFTCAVCVDVDNNFVATAPVDDNNVFVPGSTLAGTDLPLPATGQPLQQIKVHVLTPGVRGGNKKVTFSLSGTSAYPGLAMNFPIASPSTTPDMLFTNGTSTVQVNVPSSNNTVATINVYDYAANTTLTVTAPTPSGSTVTYTKKIPQDNDANGLPDAGWMADSLRILTRGMAASDDVDSDPVATGMPLEGFFGDGLTAREEYRGFVVGNQHVRLDPQHRDLFIVADADIIVSPVNAVSFWTSLPHRLRYLATSEVLAQTNIDPALNTVKPVVNPNRAGMTGALQQRAVRVRSRTATPFFRDDNTGLQWPAELRVKGYTWVDIEDLQVIHNPSPNPIAESPNLTQVVEYYPAAFRNESIAYGPNAVRDSVVDKNGNAIVVCANPTTDIGCVVLDDQNGLISKPPSDFVLWAAAGGDDYYTKVSFSDCTLTPRLILSAQQYDQARTTLMGHELAHALHVQHSGACGDLMYSIYNPQVNPQRITVLDVLPMPTSYILSVIEQMRLHTNP